MTASVMSIRKRLLECLDRRELEKLYRLEDGDKRGRDTLIAAILKNWSSEADIAIQSVVNLSKHNRR